MIGVSLKLANTLLIAGGDMRHVYEKYTNGDSISDEELKEGLAFFKKLSDDLMTLGPVFKLAAVEANLVYMAFNSYQRARNERPF